MLLVGRNRQFELHAFLFCIEVVLEFGNEEFDRCIEFVELDVVKVDDVVASCG